MRPGGMLWMDDDMEDDMVMLMLLLAQQSEEKEDEIEELGQAQAGLQAQVQTLTTQNRALQRALALADAKNAALEQRLARIERAVDEGRTVGGNKRQRVPSGKRDAVTTTAAAGRVRQRAAPAIARRPRPAT